jgi:hypothetical protein
MGYCVQGALKRLKRMQRRHPDIEILLPRAAREPWRINLLGLDQANKIDRHSANNDLSHRVGIIESDSRTMHRKLRRLEIHVFGRDNAGFARESVSLVETKLK